MDISQFAVQLVLAIGCAGAANMLIPRRIPGKQLGLIAIGLAGVWLGEWGYTLLMRRGINLPFLSWQILGVEIIPAIVGSTVILYLVTRLVRWGRYGNS
jgi:uncharacterized membrane protein YeaQ/YmgE (transglycosylase-associated protein family)